MSVQSKYQQSKKRKALQDVVKNRIGKWTDTAIYISLF